MTVARRPILVLLPLLALASACGAKRFTPPAGPGAPFADAAAAFDDATSECRGVKTIQATLSLSGRAAGQKLRGRVDTGFAAPGGARLEGRAPFGRPVFILVAKDAGSATLVFPRDNRVLRDAPPAAIVEALTGIALGPDELRSAIAGCGFGGAAPTAGRSYGDLVALDAAGTTHFVRRADNRWRLIASTRGPLTIEYRDFSARRPATVRMRATRSDATRASASTDMTVKLSDVDVNVTLDRAVFDVEIPAGADPMTLDELRRVGPLGVAIPNR